MHDRRLNPVAIWLLACCALVFAMVFWFPQAAHTLEGQGLLCLF